MDKVKAEKIKVSFEVEADVQFFADVLDTFVEGPYEWFLLKDNYKSDPTPTVSVRIDEPGAKWVFVGWSTIHAAFLRLASGPVAGLSESYRGTLLKALILNESGDLDVNDVDAIMQIALIGEIRYS